jgi:hypothetical protein
MSPDEQTSMTRDAIPLIPPLVKILHRPHRDPSNIRFHESGFLESHRVMLSQKTALLLKVSSITLATNDFGDFSKCHSAELPRTHSELVKFAFHDREHDKVSDVLCLMHQGCNIASSTARGTYAVPLETVHIGSGGWTCVAEKPSPVNLAWISNQVS